MANTPDIVSKPTVKYPGYNLYLLERCIIVQVGTGSVRHFDERRNGVDIKKAAVGGSMECQVRGLAGSGTETLQNRSS